MSCERLDEPRLPVAASAENCDLRRRRRAASRYEIDRAVFARVFTRRSPALHGARHFGEPSFLLRFRKRTNLFFVVLLGGEDVRHERAIENSTQGSNIGHLWMVLEPHRMRKASPREDQLRFGGTRHGCLVAGGPRPGPIAILLEVQSFRLN